MLQRAISPIVTFGLVLAMTSVVDLGAVNQSRVDVTGERPLHAAVKEIEKRYGVVITYEDPPFLSAGESIDVTNQRKPNSVSSSKRILAPVGGRFIFNPPTAATGVVVDRLVGDYNRSQLDATFDLRRSGEVFHIFPSTVRNRSGDLQANRSVLDQIITVPARTRNGLEMLAAIIDAVSGTGARRLLNVTPMPSPLASVKIATGLDRVNARDALMSLIGMTGRPLSWQILCQPGDGEACYISVLPPGAFY